MLTSTDPQIALIFEKQRRAFRDEGYASVRTRIGRLDRCIGLLLGHADEIVESLRCDYGRRPAAETLFAEIYSSLCSLRHARSHLRRWMRPERRRTQPALALTGGRSRVHWQPKGVVGIISPWNYPINLTFAPLAGALAAGNRVLIKPSERTPATAALIQRMIHSAFDESEVAVVTGGPQVGRALASLPLDHLLFTGSERIGREVALAAAANLVPVTLELGGKSPVVIGSRVDLDAAARRIAFAKMLNAGQVCIAPDYALVPESTLERFVQAMVQAMAAMVGRDNPDHAAMIDSREAHRLAHWLSDAEQKGARVVRVSLGGPSVLGGAREDRALAPALVVDARDDMEVMGAEVFGPILPVIAYRSFDEVVARINARPRPLALYYFGGSRQERRRLLEHTTSGGMSIGDVLVHASVEDLPFGGIGASGMGRYHGRDGFRELSHPRAVYSAGLLDLAAFLRPPYSAKKTALIRWLLVR